MSVIAIVAGENWRAISFLDFQIFKLFLKFEILFAFCCLHFLTVLKTHEAISRSDSFALTELS